ncbi:MAG: hypothetical protein MJ180_04630 [Candidatus Gastranaerophilales bacterium]|nr:hypothetical protein [Candidatus Gastranaerophilales bacterium]
MKTINRIAQEQPELTIIFISQRIEDILPVFTSGMILNSGVIDKVGSREEVLTEENLKHAFNIDVKLIQSDNGRLWAITD